MSVSALDAKPQSSPVREEFYGRLAKKNAAPLWEVLAKVVPPTPTTPFIPALWKYDEMRPLLMESGGLISAQEAERRVLVLQNPGTPSEPQITGTLYAGLQLVLPGEIAPSHRHRASALRFVVESDGGYTAVSGEKLPMHPGDFILTPSWQYHDHGNAGDGPVIWMDVLDLPLINLMGTSFAEHHPQETQQLTQVEGDSMSRYGSALFPYEYNYKGIHSPLLNYTYAYCREAIYDYSRHTDLDACHGYKMQHVNPATGGPAMKSIGTFMQVLPKGFSGKPYRGTDGTIYTVLEGRGHSIIGGQKFEWGPRDVFVIPSWYPVSHHASEEAVLFSASDRPIQKTFGLWREDAPCA